MSFPILGRGFPNFADFLEQVLFGFVLRDK